MKSVLFHQYSNFTKPEVESSYEKELIAQAYIGWFLTKKGSLPLDSEDGSTYELGEFNDSNLRFIIQQMNFDILKIIKEPYKVANILIEDILEDKSIIINLVLDNGETVNVNVQ